MNTQPRIPLRPDYSAAARARTAPIIRAAAAILKCHVEQRHLKDVLKLNFPNDKATELVVKAATSPASMTNAADLVGLGVADFVSVLGPASAGATLLSRGLQFSFDNTGQILVSGVAADANNATFVREGFPIPTRQFNTGGGCLLQPRKFAAISVFTSESIRHSTPNVELLVRQVLSESIGLALDTKMFDATAGDETRVQGLRFGSAAGTVSGSATPSEAMSEDVATLVGATAVVAGNNPVVFIAAARQAAALRLWARPNFNYEVLSSGGLTDRTVLCVASNAICSVAGSIPRFSTATDTALHMEDTTPRNIDTQAVSESVRSLFQSDLVGLRAVLEVSWGLRNSGGLSWLENVNW